MVNRKLAGTVLLGTLCSGCGPEDSGGVTSSKGIASAIEGKLSPGDDRSLIERVTAELGARCSLDTFNRRYQCIIRDPNPELPIGYHAISIYLYLDEQNRFLRSEVRDSYSMI
jgi:hypothetical protein